MSTWALSWHGVRTVTRLELRQRVRSTRWIVSLVVFAVLVGGVSWLTWNSTHQDQYLGAGRTMFGFIVFFVLFLGLLVSPTLSATAINGDRAAGTLATLQVTLLTPAEIVFGKLLASWVASLAFLGVSVPFIVWAYATGGTPPLGLLTTLALLALMLAVVCAIGLGFSALTARTAGSAVLTYVAVASLTLLTLIFFGLSMSVVGGEEQVRVRDYDWAAIEAESGGGPLGQPDPRTCQWRDQQMYVAHTERTWWLLAVNPFVVVADAMPDPAPSTPGYLEYGDPMSAIKFAVRSTRLGPPESYDYCGGTDTWTQQDADELGPVWPWGLAVNLLLGAGGVVLAVRRLRIPQRTLPKGVRVA